MPDLGDITRSVMFEKSENLRALLREIDDQENRHRKWRLLKDSAYLVCKASKP